MKAEKQYSFSLEQSLRRAQEKPLFYVSVHYFVDQMVHSHWQETEIDIMTTVSNDVGVSVQYEHLHAILYKPLFYRSRSLLV